MRWQDLRRHIQSEANTVGGPAEPYSWMGKGKTDGEIAHICSVSLRTAQKHAENIYTKLGGRDTYLGRDGRIRKSCRLPTLTYL